ncbi:MAG TPA: B12-binding domain-containing radical SAM protein [Candidatus Hydrogenedentes bacterium]|nr:B12-binding domain-containing radical SAM protein [Candidatus Hydrogenedentota bacterium]
MASKSVLLFRPIYDPESASAPATPWGLLYVAAPLVAHGFDITIIDESVTPDYQECVRAALDKYPVAVGISAMTGRQIGFGLAFAQFVRKHGNAPIVWGGIHPTMKPEQTARHGLVDYVVVNEGEQPFLELVERLAQGKEPDGIPGVYFVRNGAICGEPPRDFVDLAALPPIPFDLLDVERYIVRRPDLGAERSFEICTSRGCPHRCAFCYIQSVHKSRWRSLDADAAFRQLSGHVERFDLDCVVFREDNFFADRRRVEQLAQRMVDERLDIKWTASCRIDYFAKYTAEFVDLLRRSGCVLLTFGVESGSARILDFIKKDITPDMVREVVQKVKDSGIRGTYHFMGGFPTETAGELLDTCQLIEDIRRIAPEAVVREMSAYTAYPGVELIQTCKELGHREPDQLEDWLDIDFREDPRNSRRPWLNESQSRLLSNIQFLIARLNHKNSAMRAWTRRRWRQMLASELGIALPERPAIEFAKRMIRGR